MRARDIELFYIDEPPLGGVPRRKGFIVRFMRGDRLIEKYFKQELLAQRYSNRLRRRTPR